MASLTHLPKALESRRPDGPGLTQPDSELRPRPSFSISGSPVASLCCLHRQEALGAVSMPPCALKRGGRRARASPASLGAGAPEEKKGRVWAACPACAPAPAPAPAWWPCFLCSTWQVLSHQGHAKPESVAKCPSGTPLFQIAPRVEGSSGLTSCWRRMLTLRSLSVLRRASSRPGLALS